jgi:Uma2 family endonuclease
MAMTTDASPGPVSTEKGLTNPLPLPRPTVDLSQFVIEDDEPIENIFAEKQYRLLTHTLYISWAGPRPGSTFLVVSNVGLFGAPDQLQALCPDVMLAVDVRIGGPEQRRNRSYFVWERGKAPDVVIEIVSDRRGGEADRKLAEYARIGVPYYVVFDPEDRLREGVLRSFALRGGAYELMPENRYPEVGLGLVLWRDQFEDMRSEWIRWCDLDGRFIPIAVENALRDRELIDQERQRAEQAERDRSLANERAEQAERDRKLASERAEQEREARERLEAKLRALGIDPNA